MSEKTERDRRMFQSYLDNIKAKTGKTPDDFRVLAQKKKLTQHGEIMAWLKSEFELGHGHANVITQMIKPAEAGKVVARSDDRVGAHFTGGKAAWRKAYDGLAAKILKFGPDVEIAPNNTYINLVRGLKKFGIVQVSTTDRLDIGIKLKGEKPTGRFEAAGSWNAMVTHRVRVTDAKQIDKDVLAWLKRAYEAAQ